MSLGAIKENGLPLPELSVFLFCFIEVIICIFKTFVV